MSALVADVDRLLERLSSHEGDDNAKTLSDLGTVYQNTLAAASVDDRAFRDLVEEWIALVEDAFPSSAE